MSDFFDGLRDVDGIISDFFTFGKNIIVKNAGRVIISLLFEVSESKLSTENSQRIRAMFKIVSEIESVADSSLNIAKAINRRNEQKVVFPEELTQKLKHMFSLVIKRDFFFCLEQ